MQKNSFGEERLCQMHLPGGPYFISRDREGKSVLREKDPDGKELFATELDDGTKNKDKERVYSALLLYDVVESRVEKAKETA